MPAERLTGNAMGFARQSVRLGALALTLVCGGAGAAASAQEAEHPIEPGIDAPAAVAAPVVLDGLEAMVLGGLPISRGSMQDLTFASPGNLVTVQVMIAGQPATIDLAPYTVRDPEFKLFITDERGELEQIDPPPPSTYRGQVRERGGAPVYASIINGQLRGRIAGVMGDSWMIEPATKTVPGLPESWHVVYHSSDVLAPTDPGCGVEHADLVANDQVPVLGNDHGRIAPDTEPVFPEGDEGARTLAGTIDGRTQVGFDGDFEYFTALGSVTACVNDIEWLVNQVSAAYQSEVSICYALTGIIIRTSEPDPYTQISPTGRLCDFTNEWNNNVADSSAGIPRDEAHLMTGASLSPGFIGWAWGNSICDNVVNICGANQVQQHALSVFIVDTDIRRINLTAHEFGHNWQGCHCNQSGCTGDGADPDCGIMHSNIISVLTFGNRAFNAITGYRDTRTCLQTCYNPIYVDAAAAGFQDGSAANPYDLFIEGAINAMAGGTIRAAGGNYPEILTIQKNVMLRKWDGTAGTVIIGE